MTSRFNSPTTLTSSFDKGALLAASVKDDHTREILGFVGVEILFHPGEKAQELSGHDKRSKHRQFRPVKPKLKDEIARVANDVARVIADCKGHATQFVHFGQHLALGFEALLAQEKREARGRADNRFRAMSKFERVKKLAVGTRHFRNFQGGFAGQRVKGPLPEKNIIGKR